MRLLLTLVLVLLSTGCVARMNKTMASWVGTTESALIAAWGPPSTVTSDGNGGKILVFQAERQWTTPDTRQAETTTTGRIDRSGNIDATSTTRVTGQAPQTQGYTASRIFYVNSEGVVYSWKWQGF